MLNELTERYPVLATLRDTLTAAADMLLDTYRAGGKILACGNGGSCADCEHIVGELMKGFLQKRALTEEKVRAFDGLCDDPAGFAARLQAAIPAISLPSQTAILSAFCNDVDPTMCYAQLAYAYATPQDVLIAISTSGESRNVVNAVIAARARGAKTLALTGAADSRLSALCDITINVPAQQTHKVQELHLPIYHYLCAEVERRAFSEKIDK